uniref:dehydration-responsive element-binding protein 1E-like n=1 Tax=Erigeron canadensis TaxID=72917 RepID=UPI001CB8DC91|nr:dehydration-responsive element-binding protein 1E-like [Erigeron canadensis]
MDSYYLFPTISSSPSRYHYNTNNSTNIGDTNTYSESEVMLASENPKKRAGRKKFKETRHPIYRGVRSRDNGKWVCEVRDPITQSRVWLGTHTNAIMAARAHDVAVLAMRGPSACLNFADSVWRLPAPESNDIKDIQKAAAEAAETFRHMKEDEIQVVMMIDEEMPENDDHECYVDEEDMPGFIDSMANGLMVSPPEMVGYGNFINDLDFSDEMTLWSF